MLSIFALVGSASFGRSVVLDGQVWSLAERASLSVDDLARDCLWAHPNGAMSVHAIGDGDQEFIIDYPGMACIAVDLAARRICYARDSNVSDETLKHLLADQVFPEILAHESRLVLHAGAVRVGNGAVIFLAPSGRGKSTLVASMVAAGCGLIGDDAVIIAEADGQPTAQAVYPSLRLLPDSLAALYDERPDARRIADYTHKQRIVLATDLGEIVTPVPISAIFFLEGHTETIEIDAMRPGDACMGLIENSFWLAPADLPRSVRKMQQAASLITSAPAFRLGYPRDYARLPEVHAAIVAQIADDCAPVAVHKPASAC